MPIYVFHCQSCDETIEVLQSYYDSRPTIHESCGGNLTQKFGIPAAFIGPQTLGSIAEKNTSRMSEDYRRHLTEQNKTKKVRTSRKSMGPKADLNKTQITKRKGDVEGSKLKRYQRDGRTN